MTENPPGTDITSLFGLHSELGAKMVPFAGYAMPLHYRLGILKEHRHTRDHAGLFDVSHMGQIEIRGDQAAEALESLVVGDIAGLRTGRIRYTLLTDDNGGILDDLMVARREGRLHLVVNAARKRDDFSWIIDRIGDRCDVAMMEADLVALQGPEAAAVLVRFVPAAADMPFMSQIDGVIAGHTVTISRCGYTGEDGFEISLPIKQPADQIARQLLAEPQVQAVGLGARDSLRLEAGLCLYGQDIDTTTTPVEAGLAWTIGKRRCEQGGFPGADVILRQLREGPGRMRVGIRPEGRAPARAHTVITDPDGTEIGEVTSGGFGPSIGGPVAMGYVRADRAEPGTELRLVVRGTPQPARVVPLPFVPHRYRRTN